MIWTSKRLALGLLTVLASMALVQTRHIVTNSADLPLPGQSVSGAPDNTCEAHAERGHCKVYSCLDRELSCGNKLHYDSIGRRFCDVTRRHSDQFETDAGVTWAQQTSRCMTQTLWSLTSTTPRQTWCATAPSLIKSAFVDCAKQHGICDVLWAERHILKHTFRRWSWLSVVQAAGDCPREDVNNFMFWMMPST